MAAAAAVETFADPVVLWGLDVPCVHVAVHARDRAFAALKAALHAEFTAHKAGH